LSAIWTLERVRVGPVARSIGVPFFCHWSVIPGDPPKLARRVMVSPARMPEGTKGWTVKKGADFGTGVSIVLATSDWISAWVSARFQRASSSMDPLNQWLTAARWMAPMETVSSGEVVRVYVRVESRTPSTYTEKAPLLSTRATWRQAPLKTALVDR
jgi:hypothetical protein